MNRYELMVFITLALLMLSCSEGGESSKETRESVESKISHGDEVIPDKFLGRSIHKDAAEEVHFWGRLIGDWETYDADGNQTREGTANWHWFSALGGFAIQEFSAIQVGDTIIMSSDGRELESRILFFDMGKNKFRQQEETSDDNGITWYPTYMAYATKRAL